MSSSDLLSSTLNWPGKALYGLKSSVLQTSESNLVKQTIVTDHMRNHYRRLNGARSAIDSKPPKAMILGQKSRDRARKEMAQLAYTENILNEFSGGTPGGTPRRTLSQSARSRNMAQSQPTTFRARSRSIEGARMMTRSLNVNGSRQNLNQSNSNDGGLANKLFGNPTISQALTAMAALGKITSSERNKSSADVLDKHPDAFSQPNPNEHQPRLVKRDGTSSLVNNRSYYNPPRKVKSRPTSAVKEQTKKQEVVADENKKKEDEQLALSIRRVRDQLNRSLEIRQNVEKKIKKAKATAVTNTTTRKQADEILKGYGLTEHERLQYVKFMQEITDAIIRNNLTTESAIEKQFEIHIDRNRDKLDERRLRGLLEALKQDLGVESSRKIDTYASVKKATTYDNEPPSRKASIPTRDDPLALTPKTPHSNRRRSSFDINEPLPWEVENNADKQPTVKPRHINESQPKTSTNEHAQNPFNDDYLFSTPTTVVKPKPRSTLQTIPQDHFESHDIPNTLTSEQESTTPVSFNATVRAPMTELNNMDWLTDSQPARTTVQQSSFHHVQEEDDAANDYERQTPSPLQNHHHESDTYGSNDFEENDNSEQ